GRPNGAMRVLGPDGRGVVVSCVQMTSRVIRRVTGAGSRGPAARAEAASHSQRASGSGLHALRCVDEQERLKALSRRVTFSRPGPDEVGGGRLPGRARRIRTRAARSAAEASPRTGLWSWGGAPVSSLRPVASCSGTAYVRVARSQGSNRRAIDGGGRSRDPRVCD